MASPIIFIVGETASGKTSTSIKLAQTIGGEIICADSRTIYKYMDVGTAKPTISEQNETKHHLLDIIEPDQQFSVSEFKDRAQKCIQDIIAKNKVPIVVGGTGLYINSLLYNYQFVSVNDTNVRYKIENMNDDEITTYIKNNNIDSTKVDVKNRRHFARYVERGMTTPSNTKPIEGSLVLGLKLSREVLNDRITKRVDQMFNDGFLEEVESVASKYGWDNSAMSGIGYSVAKSYFEGKSSIEEVKEAFIRRDMSLAKRQRTWFKRNPYIQWFDEPDKLNIYVENQLVKL